MRKILKPRFWLWLIVILAFLLRFWQLGGNPPSLTWDEAAWGYNAYSIGLTGRDEFGRLLPWNYLESFGDFKPPVYAYLAVLPVKLFGLNELATRFPSALLGVLTVFFTYFLVKELWPKSEKASKLGLLAAFFLAISPWHFMLSRAAFEANVASFFLVAGVTLFLRGLRKENWLILLSAACFALSLNTFNTARVMAPLLVLGLLIGFRKKVWERKKWILGAAVLGLMVLLPSLSFFLSPQAKLRYREVNIFSDAAVVEIANQEMENDNWAWWSSLIHNRRWGYFRAYLSHYFHHFNPHFLFVKGDGNPKFSTQDVGELYLWELPFLIIGILFWLKKKPGFWWLVPFWLLTGIIPAATARETPHALRIETTLPTWQILVAFGTLTFIDWLKTLKSKRLSKTALYLAGFLLFLNFFYFQHGYWRHYPYEYSGEWQYGYQPVIEYLQEVGDRYDEIWLTDKMGRPYIYFLFHFQKDPREFWSEVNLERSPYGFVFVHGFDRYHFFRDGESLKPEKEALIIQTLDRIPQDEVIIKEFKLLNNQTVLGAYTNLPDEEKDSEI